MAISVKYTKAQYEAKITELEGYYSLLETHLARMQELKNEMFNFWNDPNAQTVGQILAIRIRAVQSSMDLTKETLIFYKSTVEKLDGANLSVKDMLDEAMSVLGALF